jgi:hypothetical protein
MKQEHERSIKAAEMQHGAVIEASKQTHEGRMAEHDGALRKYETESKAGEKKETSEKHGPSKDVLAKLSEAVETLRKPRTVVRDKNGQITGIH